MKKKKEKILETFIEKSSKKEKKSRTCKKYRLLFSRRTPIFQNLFQLDCDQPQSLLF